MFHSLGICKLPLISHYRTNTAPKWTLNVLFIYLFIFLSSSAGCQFCWWSVLAEWTSVFLWAKMQQARLLLLDKPSEVSQGPPTELSIKKDGCELCKWMCTIPSWIHLNRNYYFLFSYRMIALHSVSTALVASLLLLGVCWCNHCTASVRSEVLLNKIQLSRREQ